MREMEYPSYPASAGPRLHWSAIFAGAATTLAFVACLNVLGVGLNQLPAAAGAVPPNAFAGYAGQGGVWWTAFSGVVAYFCGGWLASRLCDSGRRSDGAFYGLVSWSAATLAALYLPAFALGGVLSIAASGVTVFAILVGEAIAAAVGGVVGARLYVPVPVEQYRRTHRREISGIMRR